MSPMRSLFVVLWGEDAEHGKSISLWIKLFPNILEKDREARNDEMQDTRRKQ